MRLDFTKGENAPGVLQIRAAEFFEPRFPFHTMRLVMRREDWREVHLRRRDFWKLVCILDGKGRYVSNRPTVAIEGGDMLLVGPDEATAFQVDSEEMRIVNLLFQPSWLKGPDFGLEKAYPEFFSSGKGMARRGHYARLPKDLLRFVKEMEVERLRQGPAFEAILRLRLAELLHKLTRIGLKATRAERAARALELVEERLLSSFDEPFSLKALAKEARFHPNALARLYRKARGRALSDAWESRRVEKACEYLASSEMSVTRIAGEVGFNDLSFFYKVFKRYRGMAPGDWRAKQREDGKPATRETAPRARSPK